MYLPKIKGETIKKDGKKLRGISNNKIGIGVATNKEKSIFIFKESWLQRNGL